MIYDETIYDGMKLEEVTEPQVFDAPREMLAWNSVHPTKRMIVAILPGGTAVDIDRNWLSHCAYVPEKAAPRRATHRELSRWLAQGNGEYTRGIEVSGKGPYTKTSIYYDASLSNSPVDDAAKVRKWDDADWHEPTADYLGLEDKCRK